MLDYSITDQILEDCTTLSKVCNTAIMEDDVSAFGGAKLPA